MRGEKYEITYLGDPEDLSGSWDVTMVAIWVPDAKLLFQREQKGRVTNVYHRESFPPEDTRVISRRPVEVLYSVIKAARKDLQEQEEIDKRQDVLEMAQNRLWSKDQRRKERLNRKTENLFVL